MAAPKPDPAPPPEPDDFWTLPPDGSANVLDDARWERMLRLPGVVVHRRNDELANRPITPIRTVGHMSIEEPRRLLGREPDDDWDNEWSEDEGELGDEAPTATRG